MAVSLLVNEQAEEVKWSIEELFQLSKSQNPYRYSWANMCQYMATLGGEVVADAHVLWA